MLLLDISIDVPFSIAFTEEKFKLGNLDRIARKNKIIKTIPRALRVGIIQYRKYSEVSSGVFGGMLGGVFNAGDNGGGKGGGKGGGSGF